MSVLRRTPASTGQQVRFEGCHRSRMNFRDIHLTRQVGTVPEHGIGLHHFNQPLMLSIMAFVDIP